MTPAVKRCCLLALEKPSKKVARVMEQARQGAWHWDGDKTIQLKLPGVERLVTKGMNALRNSGVISEWQFELRQDGWGQHIAKIQFTYFTKVYYTGLSSYILSRSSGTLSVRLP